MITFLTNQRSMNFALDSTGHLRYLPASDGHGTAHLTIRIECQQSFDGQQFAPTQQAQFLWPAAVPLCNALLADRRRSIDGQRVLELGCGVGLIGVYLARTMRPRQIIMTEYDESMLVLPRENWLRNGLSKERLSTEVLDWARPRHIPCDTIVGSDLFYDENGIELVASCLEFFKKPAVLAVVNRSEYLIQVFEERLTRSSALIIAAVECVAPTSGSRIAQQVLIYHVISYKS